jgi:transcriptional regulator with XRE-family HTH domain
MIERDFNNLKDWLPGKIRATGLSFEQFARAVGITRTMIYNYIDDKNRPETQTMVKICQLLQVPLEEGLSQYTPRKVGRPPGLK